ncbi:hypothetical protein EON83_24005 [bacterium]|nr:MAG: hypothetical protein EON83_24005 [bacterium]
MIGGCSRTPTAPTPTDVAVTQAIIKDITGNAKGARDEARTLFSQSEALLAAGNYNGAMDKRLEMLSIRGQDPSTFGALTAYAIQQMAFSDLENVASHLDAPSCRKYAGQLTALDAKMPTHVAMLQADKARILQQLATRSRDPKIWKAMIADLGDTPRQQQALNKMPVSQIKGYIEKFYNARVNWALKPYSTKWVKIRVDPYTRLVIGDTSSDRFLWTDRKTERLLTIVALQQRADELEKKKRAWPLPTDPFGSGPLKEKAVLVYSVGPDAKDDGGKSVPNPKSVQDTDKGDIPAPTF